MRSITAVLRFLRNGILGVLEVSNKAAKPTHRYVAILSACIRIYQMWSFVSQSPPQNPWPSSLSALTVTGGVTNLNGFRHYLPSFVLAGLVWGGYVWVALLALLMVWGVWCFAHNSFPALWPLHVLRTMGNLSAGVLFIPLLQIILQTDCSTAQGQVCSSVGVILQLVASIIAATFLTALSLLFKAVFYDSNIFSKDLNAQAHGRLNIVLLVLQLALVIALNVLNLDSSQTRVIILGVVGLLWLAAQMYFMSYYAHSMNRLWIVGASVFLCGVAAMCFNVYVPAIEASYLLYTMIPLAIGSGIALADWRANAVVCCAPERLTTPYELELKGRYLLHSLLYGHPFFVAAQSLQPPVHGGSTAIVVVAAGGHNATGGSVSRPPAVAATSPRVEKGAPSAASSAGVTVPPQTRDALLELYRGAGVARFVGTSMYHLFTSRLYGDVLSNRHMQMSHLLQSDRCSPAFDVAFTVFQTRRALENEASSHAGGVAVSALSRVSLDKHAADARRNVQRAASRQLAFWNELNDVLPDISRLHALAADTNEAIRAAEANFTEIFALQPQALAQLRLCAAFQLHVTGNADKATVLLGEADRIEDARSRDHRTEAGSHLDVLAETNLDVWSDNTAIVTTSSNLRDLGVIQSINSAACKLFGYTRIQLERRSVFTLMPPPFDRLHEESLRQYCTSGEAALGVVDFSRTMLVYTKQGTVFQVLSSFKDAAIDEGASYIWALRELRSDNHCVVCDGDGVVLAVSAGTQAQWGIDPDLLSSRSTYVASFIPSWDSPSARAELAGPGGGIIEVSLPVVGGGAFEGDGGSDAGSDSGSLKGGARSEEGEEEATSPRNTSRSSRGLRGLGSSSTLRTEVVQLRVREQRIVSEGASYSVLHWQRLTPHDTLALSRTQGAATIAPAPSGPGGMRRAGSFRRGGSVRIVEDATADSAARPSGLESSAADEAAMGLLFRDSIPAPANVAFSPKARPAVAPLGRPPSLAKQQPRELLESSAPRRSAAGATPAKASSGKPPRPPTHSATMSDGDSTEKDSGDEGGEEDDEDDHSVVEEHAPGVVVKVKRSGSKGGSHGGGGSAGGSSKGSSVTNTARSLNRLRKIVSAENPPMLPSLVFLRAAGVVLTVLAIVLAVVVSVITNNAFDLISDDIAFVTTGSTKMVYKASAILAAQNLILDGRGWKPISAAERALSREQILGNATLFEDAHQFMAGLAAKTQGAWQWTTRYITLSYFNLPPEGVYTDLSYVNLIEVGSAFSRLMQQLASLTVMPDAAYNVYTNGCALGNQSLPKSTAASLIASLNVDYMRGGNGHETLSASIELGFNAVIAAIDNVSTTMAGVFAGMCLVTIALGTLLFVPIIRRLDIAGDMIMRQFIDIPLSVRRVLAETAAKRVRLLRRDYADDEDDDVDSEVDEDETSGVPSKAALAGGGPEMLDVDESIAGSSILELALGKAESAIVSQADVSEGFSESSRGKQRRGARGGTRRVAPVGRSPKKYRKSTAAFCVLVFRFVFPLFLLIALFATIYGTYTLQAVKTKSLVSLAVASGVRASCGRQAVVDMRKLEYLTTDANYITRSFFFVMSSLDCVRSEVRLLAYGTVDPTLTDKPFVPYVGVPEDGRASYLSPSTTETAYQVMFTNACPFLKSVAADPAAFNISACESFGSGVLKLGLAATVEMWWQKGYVAADRQLKGIFNTDELYESRGWLLNPDTFDYSTVKCSAALGCDPNLVVPPLRTGVLNATWISDPSYVGDVYPGTVTTRGDCVVANCTNTYCDSCFAVENLVMGPSGMYVSPGSKPYWSGYELNTDEMKFLLDSDALYLTPGLVGLQNLYAADADASIAAYLSFVSVFVPVFITAFVLLMALWFLPETIRENKRMQTKRAMLLHIPTVVVARIPSIRALINDICAADAGALGSASVERSGGGGGGGSVRSPRK